MKIDRILKYSAKRIGKTAKKLADISNDKKTPENLKMLSAALSSCLTSLLSISCSKDLKYIYVATQTLKEIEKAIPQEHFDELENIKLKKKIGNKNIVSVPKTIQ